MSVRVLFYKMSSIYISLVLQVLRRWLQGAYLLCAGYIGDFAIQELYSSNNLLDLTGRRKDRTSWLSNFKGVGLIGVGQAL